MNTRFRRLPALLLAFVLLLGLIGCGETTSSATEEQEVDPALTQEQVETKTGEGAETGETPAKTDGAEGQTPAPESGEETEESARGEEEKKEDEPKINLIVYATTAFDQVFSPFFASFPADEEAVNQVVGKLLATDRTGAVVRSGIEGETLSFNGSDYSYYGMGSVEIVQNGDGTVDYHLSIRSDIVFSDGVPATIDDVIFSLYVLADPLYDGPSRVGSLPIEGMEAYRSGMEQRGKVIFADGQQGYTPNDAYSQEQYTAFWNYYNNEAGADFAREIIAYLVGEGYSSPEDSVADCAAKWGFALAEDATVYDFWNAIVADYDGDTEEAEANESAGSSRLDLTLAALGSEYQAGVVVGETAENISGVYKTGDFTATVHMTRYDAGAIYSLNLPVAPMHYYGDETLYDYENNSFGFVKGDLSGVKAKNSAPLGAGPYTFAGFAYDVVTLKANPFYYLGKPATEILLMQEAENAGFVSGIVSGTYDVACPTSDENTIRAVKDANGGELQGDMITAVLVDHPGYGYLGINAELVNVNGNPGSEQSKALRKGFMTLFAAYRESAVEEFYGDRASVIQYPISDTSWAAPRPEDEGYSIAYSLDVQGNPIYDESMSPEERLEAAKQAAIGYFRAAGYNYDSASGTFTNLVNSFEVMIPGEGAQNHAAYAMCSQAAQVLGEMGISLTIKDVNERVWRNTLASNNAMMWAGSWKNSFDLNMTQVYHSGNTLYNHYAIKDPELDALIEASEGSLDTEERKSLTKQAMEIVMEWGCELPLYQRKECILFSTERVDVSTIPQDMTPFWSWDAEIEKLAVK